MPLTPRTVALMIVKTICRSTHRKTQPADVLMALTTGHMIASPIFLDNGFAFGTMLAVFCVFFHPSFQIFLSAVSFLGLVHCTTDPSMILHVAGGADFCRACATCKPLTFFCDTIYHLAVWRGTISNLVTVKGENNTLLT